MNKKKIENNRLRISFLLFDHLRLRNDNVTKHSHFNITFYANFDVLRFIFTRQIIIYKKVCEYEYPLNVVEL